MRTFSRLAADRRVRYGSTLLAAGLVAGIIAAVLPHGGHRFVHRNAQRAAAAPGAPVLAAPASTLQPRKKPITMITGDQVRVAPASNGRSTVTVRPPEPVRNMRTDSFAQTFQVGGDLYSVPGPALRHLGQLDPRLFDVSYLQRAGYADLDALPVSITWRSSTHRPVPGLTSPTSGTHTAGSVRLSAAATFGRALAAGVPQIDLVSLGPAPQTQAAPAVPLAATSATSSTKLYTLTVGVTGTTGRPAFAVVAVQNLRDLHEYYSISTIAPGQQLSVSVPAGSYGVEATIFDLFADTLPEEVAFVPVPDVEVTGDTTISVDARQAKPITVSVPQAAAPEVVSLTYNRRSADGLGIESSLFTLGPGVASFLPDVHLFAKPTPAPKQGSLAFANAWELVPPNSGLQGVDAPYTYSLDFATADGVPTTLSHTLTTGDLAAVHEGIAASIPNQAAYFAYAPFHSWSTTSYALYPTVLDFPVPTQRVDYFGGTSSTVWGLSMQLVRTSPYLPPPIYGAYRTFSPGDDLTMTWGASPSVPTPEWQRIGLPDGTRPLNGVSRTTYSFICPVCRQGDVMSFNVPMSGDNDPTHTEAWLGMGSGTLSSPTGHPTDTLQFYRNGVLTQVDATSGHLLPMLPGTTKYTIDWASTIPAAYTRLATSVHSTWNFTSTRPPRPDRLPAYEVCAPDSTRECSYQPLVFASYDFGASLTGDVPAPGTETFTVTGFHQADEDAAPINRASVAVSFDDGATWTNAEVTALGGGRFRASIEQPDPATGSGYASVKVTLADAAGNTLDQTITRAYALAPR